MKLYLTRNKKMIEAVAEYNLINGSVTVLKGSTVSANITYSEKFRGARSIEKSRSEYVENGIVIKDACFKSASTAANFVTGSSTNGLTAWKSKNGNTLQSILKGDSNEQD